MSELPLGRKLRNQIDEIAAREAEANRPKVCLGLMSAGQIDLWTTDSVLSLLMRQQATGVHHVVAHITVGSGPRISEGRSQMVDAFLNQPIVAHCNWLWLVDSDMTFEPDAVERLLATAEDQDADVVGGLCFAGGQSGRIFPTLYALEKDPETGEVTTNPVVDYPRDAVVRVGATGAAFVIIHRRLLKAMLGVYGKQPNGNTNPYPWFIEGMSVTGRPYGEDVAFCMRANQLGAKVVVDTRVKTGHRKMRSLDEAAYDTMRAAIPDVEPILDHA